MNQNAFAFTQLKNLSLELLGGAMLAEVGKIKIGAKGKPVESKKGKVFRVPEKYDHFVITTNFKDPHTDQYIPDKALMQKIAEATGQDAQNLKFIPIHLLFDDPNLNMISRFSCYTGAKAWCIGDGTQAYRLKNDSEREQVACPCERVLPTYQGNDRCKVFSRFACLIQGVERIGGTWIFRTTSYNSTRSLLSSMHFLRQLTGGVLAAIPLTLTINPKTVVVPGTGEIRTVYVVNLEFHGTMEQLLDHAVRVKKTRIEYKLKTELLEENLRKQLPAVIELDEDEKDIAEEFFPESFEHVPPDALPDQNAKCEQEKAENTPDAAAERNTSKSDTGNPAEPGGGQQMPPEEPPEVLTLW